MAVGRGTGVSGVVFTTNTDDGTIVAKARAAGGRA